MASQILIHLVLWGTFCAVILDKSLQEFVIGNKTFDSSQVGFCEMQSILLLILSEPIAIGADINKTNLESASPLQMAARYGNRRTVGLLLDGGERTSYTYKLNILNYTWKYLIWVSIVHEFARDVKLQGKRLGSRSLTRILGRP